MSVGVITMSSIGVVEDPEKKIPWIISYLLSTEQSQTNLNRNSVVSLHDIVRRFGQNEPMMKTTIEEVLSETLRNYYDQANVEVSIRHKYEDPSKFDVVIACKVRYNERWYDVATALVKEHDKLSMLAEVSYLQDRTV